MTDQATTAAPISRLRCIQCGAVRDTADQDFRCPECGDLFEAFFPRWVTSSGPRAGGMSASELRERWLQRKLSLVPLDQSGVWRFRELLPALNDWNDVITLREGNTPFYRLQRCAHSAGVQTLFAKHQGMNPTGSFKDTGMTCAASFAKQAGFRWVACASTGNTSASMAAYASRGGLKSLVLIPEGKISWSKLSQSLDYGAVTCQLKTDFDGCVKVLNDLVKRMPVYLLNSVNPYRLEGQKTAAIEILEQLNWEVPDHIIIPGGNLGNSSALGKALIELKELGLISRLPKLSIIQAHGANPLFRSMKESGGKSIEPIPADTFATAIRIGNPASWKKAVRVLQSTGGACEEASEVEIALAKAEIGSDGIGCEPASAVTLAGLKKLVRSGFVKAQDTTVLVLTGHVLKDPDFTIAFHKGELFKDTQFAEQTGTLKSEQRAPIVLDPTVDAVQRVLKTAESND